MDGIAGRDMRAMSSQDVAPGVAAPDSVEGQLRSEGKRWARASGPIQVDTYVQDIVANRINQPAGRGRIGKVKTIDEYLGVEHAWVDFGRGYVLHIRTSELSRIRFVASEMPPPAPDMAAPDSVEGQLRAEGKRWERTSDAIQAGAYVQDIKQDRLNQPKGRGTIGKVLSVDEYLGAPHSWVDFGRGYVLHIRMSELATIRIVAPEMPSAAPGMISGGPARPGFIAPDNAAPDSVEGQMRLEGQRWERTPGQVHAGAYVQDILQGRANQPVGRGSIAKVLSLDEYIGMEHAWVDFGRGCVQHIRTSELCPVRVFMADVAAADYVEGQLRAEGKRWKRTRGEIGVGSYVEDILQGRLEQPAGRGAVGKVVSIYVDEQGRAVAKVDFGHGWVVGIFPSQLALVCIVPASIPAAGDAPSVEGRPEPGLLRDSSK